MKKVKITVVNEALEVNNGYKTLVKYKCLDCSTNKKPDVRECKEANCPIHSIRPYRTGKEKGKVKSYRKPINVYCYWCANNVIDEIRFCAVKGCPFYTIRPIKTDEEKALIVKDPVMVARGEKLRSLMALRKKETEGEVLYPQDGLCDFDIK